ncbi:sulfatase-like hydrolase/transferase [Candidatus Poribacteria bacterium]
MTQRNNQPQPNLLVIHTDQQSCWTLGAYGGTLIETPNIDRIGREGAILNSFFTNSAVCTPSRGCFVTGRYPHAHGAYTNNIPLNLDEVTFAQVLRENGYDTGYAGKWHLDGKRRPGWVHEDRGMGFDDNYYMFNRGHWKKIEDSDMGDTQPTVHNYRVIGDEKTYATDWLTDKAMEFIKRPRSKPFCYMVSLPDPHGPVWVRSPYDTMFHPDDMPLPATLNDENLPSWLMAAQQSSPFGSGKPNRDQRLREFLALYCGEVKLIDDSVGRIVACLEQQGVLNDTIIVFTTDHGEYAGEHGLHGKNQLYETAYRIPMLIRWPGKIAPGTVMDQVASTVDFQPSILGLMGIPPCGREQGRDASPLLRGEEVEWHNEAFIHHSSLRRAGIFTNEFELAYVKDAEPILFDRRNNPDQTHNLFDELKYKQVVAELTQRIVEHNMAVESPAARWLKKR